MIQSDIRIYEAMQRYGGSFVRHLAQLMAHADSENLERIKRTWPEYFDKYRKLADAANIE